MVQTKQATLENTKLVFVENAPNQATKVNSLQITVDMLSQNRALDIVSSPPGGIVDSDVNLVSASPSGAYSGKANHLTGYYQGSHFFHLPKTGYELYVVSKGLRYRYTGSAWTVAPNQNKELYLTKTADFNALCAETSIYYIDATSGNVDVTLEAASTQTGRTLVFKRTDASGNAVTFDLAIDGVTSSTLASGAVIKIHSDGTAWRKIA